MTRKWKRAAALILTLALTLSGCSGKKNADDDGETGAGRYLRFVDGAPNTADPQCTSGYYTIPLNVFDRLVEIAQEKGGETAIAPSLASDWQVSEDGLTYTFHLQPDVRFSNGEALTASDVQFTFERLLTHPDSCNRDIASAIRGARELCDGEADHLSGFQVIDENTFEITLDYSYAAFLACLSTPGASILDEQTTRAAGAAFGHDPALTVGTGPFILTDWDPDVGLRLAANKDCWSGAPRCAGLDIRFAADPETQRVMFEHDEVDVLDLESMGSDAEYFIHGDIYQSCLRQGPRVGITYIALNASLQPLTDVRVRKALQLSLDRQMLLQALYSNRGQLENGIFPRGLIGHNSALPEIPCDPAQAKALLSEAGYPAGFSLEIDISDNASQAQRDLITLAASMWSKVGVRANVITLSEEEFLSRRKAGRLYCYASTWSADFNDPDNFIYTFFGSAENTLSRSLCYADADVIARVQAARALVNKRERIAEYQALERRIVQEDAAWIPLFSLQHLFVVNPRVQGFRVSWNGWSSNNYRNVSIIGQ